MRWSYKTVLYELKKEGLLGSAFLDESEIELSLNEFGAAGWELVSMLETRDGIIAVLKQPLARVVAHPEAEELEEETPAREVSITLQSPVLPEKEVGLREREPEMRAKGRPEEEGAVSGIGSIRIE